MDKIKKVFAENSKGLIVPVTAIVLGIVNELATAVGIDFTPDMSVKDLIAACIAGALAWLVPLKNYGN